MSVPLPRRRHFGVPVRSASHYRPRTISPTGVVMLVAAGVFISAGAILAWFG